MSDTENSIADKPAARVDVAGGDEQRNSRQWMRDTTASGDPIVAGPELASARRSYSTHPFQLLWYLTLRELRSRYKRTALGWAWSMVNPLLNALVLSLVFGSFFKLQPPVGDPSGIHSFVLFMLGGLLPWNMFSACLNMSMGSVIGNAGLIQKVYFQRRALVVSTCASVTITFCIEMSILVVLIAVFASPQVLLWVIPSLYGVLMLAIFATGLSLLLAGLNVVYRDIQYLLGIVLTAWFYLTPIVYSITIVPAAWHVGNISIPAHAIVRWNPMNQYISFIRGCLYDFRMPTLQSFVVLAVFAAASWLIGAASFRRREHTFAEDL